MKIHLVILLVWFANTNLQAQRKSKLQINFSTNTFKVDQDSVLCMRTSFEETKKLRDLHPEIQPRLMNIQNAVFQKQKGSYEEPNDNTFYQNLAFVREFEKVYKVNLYSSEFEKEFDFYKSHPTKTLKQTRDELIAKNDAETRAKWKADAEKERQRVAYNKKIDRRNDSLKVIQLKKKHLADSLADAEYYAELRQDSLNDIANQKQDESDRKRNLAAKEQRRLALLQKYGQVNGKLIYEKQVRLGWTKQMCLDSWGKASHTTTTTIDGLSLVVWHYSDGSLLYFADERLKLIHEVN